jgi:hypothetical protein
MGTGRKDAWAEQTNELLAEVIRETWKLQQALSEGNGPTLEVQARAARLDGLSKSVHGQIARWALWANQKQTQLVEPGDPGGEG